jgi:ribosome-associated protein
MPASTPDAEQPQPAAAPAAATAGPMTSRQFALQAAWVAANTRCHDVIVLELGGLSPVCDYFVIASGTSAKQMRTVSDQISELGERTNFPAHSAAGYEGDAWILLDCFDVVVHLFSDEARRFYDLDNLWGDARKIDWQQELNGAVGSTARP